MTTKYGVNFFFCVREIYERVSCHIQQECHSARAHLVDHRAGLPYYATFGICLAMCPEYLSILETRKSWTRKKMRGRKCFSGNLQKALPCSESAERA
jgi:hypothetical protein